MCGVSYNKYKIHIVASACTVLIRLSKVYPIALYYSLSHPYTAVWVHANVLYMWLVSCESFCTCPCKLKMCKNCKMITIVCTIACTKLHTPYMLFDICFPPSSAGVGRTGTFIAVDAMMQRLKEKDDLNIYNFVTQMRTKRTFMVQNVVRRPTVHSWAS